MKKIAIVMSVCFCWIQAAQAGQAEMFAKGVISTEMPEFAISFSPDRKTVYFNRMSADRSEMGLYQADLKNSEWSNMRLVSFADPSYRDVDPFVTADGSRLYFSSNRPRPDGSETGVGYDIWYADRLGDGWSEPVHGGMIINSNDSEIYTTLTDGGDLYFTRFSADYATAVIYQTRWTGNGFEIPEAISFESDLRLTNPTVSPDGSFILLSAGRGQADIYLSRQSLEGAWSAPQKLGDAINSPYTEFAPAIADGYLYFTSERPGMVADEMEGRRPGDIYRIAIPAHWRR